MPFANRDDGLPITKIDAAIHVVRDGELYKAVVVTDLSQEDAAPIVKELAAWCTDPRNAVIVVSPNVAINWVEI